MPRDVVQLWACGRCGDTFRSEKAAKQHQGKRVREPMTPLATLLTGWQQTCHVGVLVDLGHFLVNSWSVSYDTRQIVFFFPF